MSGVSTTTRNQGVSTGPYHQGDFLIFGDTATEAALGTRLAAALDWAHLLAFHPKDASPQAIGHLDAAGWSATDIVSQILS